MKKGALFFLLIYHCSTSSILIAKAGKEKIFYPLKTKVNQSVLFRRLRDDRTLLAINPTKLLSPASLTKLVTAAACLTKYSANYHFETKVYHSGSRRNGQIKGNLIIVGSGDPFFTNEKLWELAADLRHIGVFKVTGDIIIDNSLFSDEARDISRSEGKVKSSNAYDAPISAFGVNFNTFPIAIAPGWKVGAKARVGIDPYPIRELTITNRLITARSAHDSIRVVRLSNKRGHSKLIVSGTIGRDSSIKKIYRSIQNPIWSAGELLRAFLNREGIVVLGRIKSGRLSKKATRLHTIRSYELSRIINGLNKFSNNYIADVLVKGLGANFGAAVSGSNAGSLKNGVEVLNDFLKKDVKIASHFVLKNGSGLDPKNRLTSKQIVDLLTYIHRRFDVFPEFAASLSTPGGDGSLNGRFAAGKTKALFNLVRAKTGTLQDPISACGLAGYLNHPKHGLIAFAIIENGIKNQRQPSIYDLRKRQDLALFKVLNVL